MWLSLKTLFDVILCYHVLEHVPDDREAVRQLLRVYGQDYRERLEKRDLRVRVDEYVRELGADAVGRYGLIENEEVYFCRRPE